VTRGILRYPSLESSWAAGKAMPQTATTEGEGHHDLSALADETAGAARARIARPTDQLDEVVRFYREGLWLPELDRFAGHAGYRAVMLGLPGMPYHLEFTQHDHGSPAPVPGRDNLLVLYFDDRAQLQEVATRLAALGHLPVAAENPYWTNNGAVTVEDPDHWRVVLMPQPLA
jgi:hypothetical protein